MTRRRLSSLAQTESWSRLPDETLEIANLNSSVGDRGFLRLLSAPFQHFEFIPKRTSLAISLVAIACVVPIIISFASTFDNWCYWIIALYFSVLSAAALSLVYHSQGARLSVSALMFAGGLICAVALAFGQGFGLDALRYPYLASPHIGVKLIAEIVGVGFIEETVKAIPLFVLCYLFEVQPLRLTIFYGLMAGLGFGIFEGIEYQTQVNVSAAAKGRSFDAALVAFYVYNFLRLTSTPLVHAVWTALVAIPMWLSVKLCTMRLFGALGAIAISSCLHGVYDAFLSQSPYVSSSRAFEYWASRRIRRKCGCTRT